MNIDILFTINKSYIQHLSAVISSLLLNSKEKMNFHIIHDDLLNENIELINSLFNKNGRVNFNFYKIDQDYFKDFKIQASHLEIQTFYRLLAAEVLPNTIDKVVYLDSDIIVQKDIKHLYEIDLENYYLAATNFLGFKMTQILGLKDVRDYLSAGVLVINLKKWRNDNFWLKAKEYYFSNAEKIVYGDQDILNGFLNGNWLRFGLEWNYTEDIEFRKDLYEYYFGKGIISNVINSPAIIHYIGGTKPWHLMCNNRFKDKYFQYLNYSGYSYKLYPELEFLHRKKIVIFGASNLGFNMLNQLQNKGLQVSYFVDNDVTKHGKQILGVEINSPHFLKQDSNIFVVISSMYKKEIAQQLVDLGLKFGEDFIPYDELYRIK